jgi:hypothetical protein
MRHFISGFCGGIMGTIIVFALLWIVEPYLSRDSEMNDDASDA